MEGIQYSTAIVWFMLADFLPKIWVEYKQMDKRQQNLSTKVRFIPFVMCAYSTEWPPLSSGLWANAGQKGCFFLLQTAAGREGDVGVKHAPSAHCARIVNKYLTAAAALGCLCGAFAALQDLCRLLSVRCDGLSASAERRTRCN